MRTVLLSTFKVFGPLRVTDSQYLGVGYSKLANAADMNTLGSMANESRPEERDADAHCSIASKVGAYTNRTTLVLPQPRRQR